MKKVLPVSGLFFFYLEGIRKNLHLFEEEILIFSIMSKHTFWYLAAGLMPRFGKCFAKMSVPRDKQLALDNIINQQENSKKLSFTIDN